MQHLDLAHGAVTDVHLDRTVVRRDGDPAVARAQREHVGLERVQEAVVSRLAERRLVDVRVAVDAPGRESPGPACRARPAAPRPASRARRPRLRRHACVAAAPRLPSTRGTGRAGRDGRRRAPRAGGSRAGTPAPGSGCRRPPRDAGASPPPAASPARAARHPGPGRDAARRCARRARARAPPATPRRRPPPSARSTAGDRRGTGRRGPRCARRARSCRTRRRRAGTRGAARTAGASSRASRIARRCQTVTRRSSGSDSGTCGSSAAKRVPQEAAGKREADVRRHAERAREAEREPARHPRALHDDDLGLEGRRRRLANERDQPAGEVFQMVAAQDGEHGRINRPGGGRCRAGGQRARGLSGRSDAWTRPSGRSRPLRPIGRAGIVLAEQGQQGRTGR